MDASTVILDILRTFENGTEDPGYSDITLLHDGDGGRLQVTLGIGFTEGGGDLLAVLRNYCGNAKSQFGNFFLSYIPKINSFASANRTVLSGDSTFQTALKKAGSDSLMQAAQDEQFTAEVMLPAAAFCKENGLSLPLSELVVADSYLQSGEIFPWLRDEFSANTPANGGDEKTWITQYLKARNSWLENASPADASSSYRTKFLLQRVAADDWNLTGKSYGINGYNLNLVA
jgi:chitosanase